MLLDRLIAPVAGATAVALAALTLALWLQLQDAHRQAAQLRTDLATAAADTATQRAAWADERAALAAAAQQATEQARATEQTWRQRHDQIQTDTAAQLAAARRDAAAAVSTGDRLRDHIRALAQQCAPAAAPAHPAPTAPGANPAAAPPSPPAANAGLVLADLLGRLDAAGRELAAIADARATAGRACERAYDALTAPPTPRRPAAAAPAPTD